MSIKRKISNIVYQIYIICLYIPIYVQLGWLCLKYKKNPSILWKVNPSFPYGGLICTKSHIFEKFQQQKKNNVFFIKTLYISATDTLQQKFKNTKTFIKTHKLHYPLIMKPDDGIGGIGLQFIENEKKLEDTLNRIKKDYILQEYISWPCELSVFFIKNPHKKYGKIRSITKRYTIKKDNEPELIIPSRKIICTDESHLITPALEKVFNAISDVKGFYFGRFDIRVKDMDTFSQGKDFVILEINVGAHSVALHAFDAKYSWIQRYKIFFDQFKFAFEIASKNTEILSGYPHQNMRDFLRGFVDIFKNV